VQGDSWLSNWICFERRARSRTTFRATTGDKNSKAVARAAMGAIV
jgi:hypothetical protein